jgi:hypothetical protein
LNVGATVSQKGPFLIQPAVISSIFACCPSR